MPPLSDFSDIAPAGGGRLTAVLGPTNTGKTHYALERMLAHRSGMIGLPLRLLAREIYDRIVKARGAREVALVTGEEKIIPPNARYWVATVEAMPLERDVEFLAIDEIQLAADRERGRVFTSRLLHARGAEETLLLGSDTMRPLLEKLFRNIQFLSRSRLSKLTYAGPKKVSRLPRRSAVVGFSADAVYAIAELIRRQRGGAAVVLGALSPRTRNAQAELYQSGEVDFLVATDAIGMGLNMDIDHVAFAALRKFDGRSPRNLTPAEMAQIAGRAGRYTRDGTFGVTSDCPPPDEETVLAIEEHAFDAVKAIQWRTETIDLSSIPALLRSLEQPAPRPELHRAQFSSDEETLRRLVTQNDIRTLARGGSALTTLWDVCQIPDFRKVAADQHARLVSDIYITLIEKGRISDDWLAPKINRLDRTDGDIDAIAARIAHVRTWTYLSHRAQWLQNPAYWQERARAIEDTLSDALHEKLTQRFVDRRTSTLLKRLKDDAPLMAGVTEDGEVIVEGQFVGRLLGFDFIVDPRAKGAEAKSLRAAGERALRPVLAARAAALANAGPDELTLDADGAVLWRSSTVAHLRKGPAPLRPELVVRGLDQISPNMRGRVEDRLKEFLASKIEGLLGPLIALQTIADTEGENGLKGIAKGVAFRLVENFGATSRAQFGDDLKQIDQTERAKMRQSGMRFGEYTLFMPALLKPAPARMLLLLWALWTDRKPADAPAPKAGLVSLEMNESLPHAYYYAAGYRPSGARAVRIDMLERLANVIRSARNEADMREGFEAGSQMMSLVGCSGEDFEAIMRSLGFRKHMVKRKTAVEPAPAAKAEEAKTEENAAPPVKSADAEAPQAEPAAESAGSETVAETAPTTTTTDAPAEAGPADNASETTDAPASAPTATPNGAAENKTHTDEITPTAAAAPTADTAEASEPAETEIEIALWRPAPRKNFSKPRRDRKGDGAKRGKGAGKDNNKEGGRKNAHHTKGHRKGKPNKGGSKRQRAAESPMMHEPRHRKTADPNSPFAVLAGLKADMSGDPGPNEKKDQSEKAAEKA
ncbi:MAG: helicase-related protein [Pseudomonadota bacterium]